MPFILSVGDDDDVPIIAPELAHLLDLGVYEKTREIFIEGEIDDDFGGWLTMVFRRLQLQGPGEPITVWLNTPGGDVQSMFVFYDLVTTIPEEVTVIGIGAVCSAGVLMLACADKRLVSENCVLMSHEYSGASGENLRYSEAKERRKWDDWVHLRWIQLMARHTPQDEAYWKRITERKAEFWLLGGESIVEEGLADGIFQK